MFAWESSVLLLFSYLKATELLATLLLAFQPTEVVPKLGSKSMYASDCRCCGNQSCFSEHSNSPSTDTDYDSELLMPSLSVCYA